MTSPSRAPGPDSVATEVLVRGDGQLRDAPSLTFRVQRYAGRVLGMGSWGLVLTGPSSLGLLAQGEYPARGVWVALCLSIGYASRLQWGLPFHLLEVSYANKESDRMPRARESHIREPLTNLISPQLIRHRARQLGVVKRRRRVDPVALVYTPRILTRNSRFHPWRKSEVH